MADPDRHPLTPDCAACAGLCCVAFAFDRSESFAVDKGAGEACPHLAARFRCDIHERLEAEGFPGCRAFDCHGAGQRVVQALFGGRDWRGEPEIFDGMMEAFRTMRRVHELRVLLAEARKLKLSKEKRAHLAALGDLVEIEFTAASLAAFDVGAAESGVRAFLASLRDEIESAP